MNKTFDLPYCNQTHQFIVLGMTREGREISEFTEKTKKRVRLYLANSTEAKRAKSINNIKKFDEDAKKEKKKYSIKRSTLTEKTRIAKPGIKYKVNKKMENTITWN
jgi:flagellar biosynthesis protein FliP